MRTPGTVKGKPADPWKKGKLRPNSALATLLDAMDGTFTVDGCAARMRLPRHRVLCMARTIWLQTGVGYRITRGGMLRAVYPKGRSYRQVLKPRKET